MAVVSSISTKKFVLINSFVAVAALISLSLITFFLTFLVLPFQHLRIHFFQAGIFTTAFLFGPLTGALVGGLTSSYTALAVLHNPWIIGGNAILGFFAAYFYRKMHPVKAVLAAYLIQLPYLVITDIFLAHMPLNIVKGIVFLLFYENLFCGTAAMVIAPFIKNFLLTQDIS